MEKQHNLMAGKEPHQQKLQNVNMHRPINFIKNKCGYQQFVKATPF